MKHIVKRPEPEAFSDWKSLASDDWQPTYDDLGGAPKRAVKDALMAEQGYLCCYCERRLTDADSHIEHFRPRRDPTVDSLDYRNLLCSCQSNLKKGEPRHCGNLKADWFDPDLLISPLDPDCESRFAFTGDGRIKPAEEHDPAAAETIHRLGLDIPKLNALRKNAIEPFLEEDISVEDMRRLVTGYLSVDSEGRFDQFWTTIQYLFGNYTTPR